MAGLDYSSLLGGASNLYTDYAAIRNGSYGKLMKAYYGNSSSSTGKSGSSSTGNYKNVLDEILAEKRNKTVSKSVSEANASLNSGVSNLKSAISTLQKEDTFTDTPDSTNSSTGAVTKGKTSQEKISDALQDFVTSYNNTVSAAKKSDNTGMTSHVLEMMTATSANSDKLQKIGIRINRDGTLLLDKTGVKNVDTNQVKEMFSTEERTSYGATVSRALTGASFYANSSKTTSTSSTSDTTDKNTTDTVASGTDLKADIEALTGDKLFAKTKKTDADGNEIETYDVDVITSRTSSFIKNYNELISSSQLLSNTGVSSNLSNMLAKTKSNSTALKGIGISVDKNGKLSLDQKKFKASEMADVKKVLQSYASSIETSANLVKYYASTNADSSNGYTANGSYNTSTQSGFNGLI